MASTCMFTVLLSLLCMSVSAGVPLSKRRAGIEKLNFQDINEQSVLTIGHRVHVKRQVAENSKEGSVPAEKAAESAVDDVAEPSKNKSQDTATGSLTTDAPQVSPAITETDQSVPPEITTSRLTSDQAPDLDRPTTTESSSTSIKPTSPAPTQNDKDVSLTGLPESEIDKKTTTDPKMSSSSSEHPVTSESPGPKVEVTSSPNDPTSITGVNPSINNTTQYIIPTIPIQPTTITENPILGELKVTEVRNETPTTIPKSNETDINLEAPPPPAENTTKEDTTLKPEDIVETAAANSSIITTTTTLSTTQGSSENASMPATTTLSPANPVNFEASENTTSVAENSTTVTNTPEVIRNETTTLLDLVDSVTVNLTTESSLVNETVQPDVIVPSNVSVLESEQDSNLTTVFNDLSNITTEPMPINATIPPYLSDDEESNGTVTISGDVIINNSTEVSSTPAILVNATDSNITTTTFPVINETESLPDNVTVAMVTDIPENETVANVTIKPPFLSYNETTGPEWTNETLVTDNNVTSMENSTYPTTLNTTNSADEETNVTTTQTIPVFETSSNNVTNATTTLPKDTTVYTVNVTTAAMTPSMTGAPNTTTWAPNTTTGAPNTTAIVPMTTTSPDTTTIMDSSKESTNTSASVGQSEGLSASALTAIITGSIIGFWIILGPIICLVCKVRDKRKDRYHTRLNSQSDPPADNGMVDAMIISELKKNGDSSHDNGNGTMKEKEYNTVVNDKAETERLQPNTAEHEF